MSDPYPEKFEQFWKAYPRKVAKLPAAKAWAQAGIEDDMYLAKAAIDDIEKRTRLKWWPKDSSKIPHPATWIRAQRWHDEGWESDIEQENQKPNTGALHYEPLPTSTRDMPWQEAMFGRLLIIYALKSGGLADSDKALDIRCVMMAEFVPGYEEAVATGEMQPESVGEELAQLFLAHLDKAYGLSLSESVLGLARRTTTGV